MLKKTTIDKDIKADVRLRLFHAYQAGRKAGGLFGRCSKAPNCSGASCSCDVHPPRDRTSVLAAAFRSSHVIGAGTSVVCTRWSHRAAFVGTAMCARPCRHPFFMLCFLGRRSAGTDGSCTRRAGCGLGLSRRYERRAEQRRNDKRRDCKFGSHRNVSIGYTVTANPRRAIQFRRAANIAQISYSKSSFAIAAQAFITFPNIRHVPNIGFAQSASNSAFAIGGIRSVRERYQESWLPKMRGDDGIADH